MLIRAALTLPWSAEDWPEIRQLLKWLLAEKSRLRLDGVKRNKARRSLLPARPRYEWDVDTLRFRFDPDEQVRRAIRLLFERFRLDGSAYGVARYSTRHGLPLPARDVRTRALRWGPPRQTLLDRILHNPIYAGAGWTRCTAATSAGRGICAVSGPGRLLLERARYDARLADRRYKAIDLDHRVVAREDRDLR